MLPKLTFHWLQNIRHFPLVFFRGIYHYPGIFQGIYHYWKYTCSFLLRGPGSKRKWPPAAGPRAGRKRRARSLGFGGQLSQWGLTGGFWGRLGMYMFHIFYQRLHVNQRIKHIHPITGPNSNHGFMLCETYLRFRWPKRGETTKSRFRLSQ